MLRGQSLGLRDDGAELVEQLLAAAAVFVGTFGDDARGVEQGAGEVVAGAELLGRDDRSLEVTGRLLRLAEGEGGAAADAQGMRGDSSGNASR